MSLTSKLQAYCYSFSCTGHYGSYHSKSIKKDVGSGMISCPDCKSALMWRKVSYRRGASLTKKRYIKITEKEYFEGA